ncbi:hypothetical protein [Metabacillus fastidiosus]|uniref:hypothetical protein n=1 Tax=Metabacillus fastidiosus TaxID=1458 RepID=UPI003D2B86C8
MNIGDAIKRKITATFFTTAITAIALACAYMAADMRSSPLYQLGKGFLSMFFVYSIYVGTIILIYGNIVSAGLEYIHRKWFINHTWLYVLLHGLLGLVNGIIFPEFSLVLMLSGMVAALLYAFIDRWIYSRMKAQKNIKGFFIFPVFLFASLWLCFQIISETLPPFTKEEAIEFAADGTPQDVFPKKAGKWEGVINGYNVERETSVKEIGKEKYIVTFTERWAKGTEKGSSRFSYEVDRQSATAYSMEGEEPPY